jgi:hypothetical protein
MNRGAWFDRGAIGSILTAVTKTPGRVVGVGFARPLVVAAVRAVAVTVGRGVSVAVAVGNGVAATMGAIVGTGIIVGVAVFPVNVDGINADDELHALNAIAAIGTTSAMRTIRNSL